MAEEQYMQEGGLLRKLEAAWYAWSLRQRGGGQKLWMERLVGSWHRRPYMLC